jgi:regulator of replication initiation timing
MTRPLAYSEYSYRGFTFMPLFNKSNNDESDATDEIQLPAEASAPQEVVPLHFSQAKKGWDPAEVRAYIDGLLDQHEEELEAVVERLRSVQEEGASAQAAAEHQTSLLEEARDAALAKAEEFEVVLREAQDGDASTHAHIAALEAKLAERGDDDGLAALQSAQAELEMAQDTIVALQAAQAELELQLRKAQSADDGKRVFELEAKLAELEASSNNPLLTEASDAVLDELRAEAQAARDEATALGEELQTLRANDVQRDEEYNRLSESEATLRAELEQLETLRAELHTLNGKYEEMSQHVVGTSDENAALRVELERLRAENPTISDTARRMQEALEFAKAQHEADMAAEREAAQAEAAATVQAAKDEAQQLAQSTVVELEHSVQRYATQIESMRLDYEALLAQKASAIEALERTLNTTFGATQATYQESINVVSERYRQEHAQLIARREELRLEVAQLEARRATVLSPINEVAQPSPAEDPFSPVAQPPHSPFENAAQPATLDELTHDLQDAQAPAFERLDDPVSPLIDDVFTPVDTPQTLHPSYDAAVEALEHDDEPVYTAPASDDAFAGFASSSEGEEPLTSAPIEEEEHTPTVSELGNMSPSHRTRTSHDASADPFEMPAVETGSAGPETDPFADSAEASINEDAEVVEEPSVEETVEPSDFEAENTEERAPRIFTEDE